MRSGHHHYRAVDYLIAPFCANPHASYYTTLRLKRADWSLFGDVI